MTSLHAREHTAAPNLTPLDADAVLATTGDTNRLLLNALHGHDYAARIEFIDKGDQSVMGSLGEIPSDAQRFYPIPENATETPFVYALDKGVEADAWLDAVLRPSAVLRKGDINVMFWALEAPTPIEAVQPFLDRFEVFLDEPIPLPGCGEWNLIHADESEVHTLDAVLDTYCPVTEEVPAEAREAAAEEPVQTATPGFWRGARIATPGYDPDADPDLKEPVVISLGASRESKKWTATQLPALKLFETLVTHTTGPKDGPGFVGGEVIGNQRKADAMKYETLMGFDFDNGTPIAEIEAEVLKSDLKAVCYSTHSHEKTSLEFPKSRVTKFAETNGLEFDEDDCTDVIRALMESEGYHPTIYKNAVYHKTEHVERGIMVFVTTPPIPKVRVVFILEKPFVFAKEGRDQQAAKSKWKGLINAVACSNGLSFYDKSGTDPSRLFYLPRHAKGRPCEAIIFGGKRLDLDKVDLGENDLEAIADALAGGGKSKSKSKTEEGRALGEWFKKHRASGFQAADIFEAKAPDKVRFKVDKGLEIECPFDDEHSNPGDPTDRACLVSNAGDFVDDCCTFKCQHETCRDKTLLDMLGRAIKLGWLCEDDLWDEEFNSVEGLEGRAPPETPPDVLEDLINNLSQKTSAAAIEVICEEIAEVKNETQREILINALYKATGLRKSLIAKKVEDKRREKSAAAATAAAIRAKPSSNGLRVHRHAGDLDEVDVKKELADVMIAQNMDSRGKNIPNLTYADGKIHQLIPPTASQKAHFKELDSKSFNAFVAEKMVTLEVGDKRGNGRKFVTVNITDKYLHGAAARALPQTPRVETVPFLTKSGKIIRREGWHGDEDVFLDLRGLKLPAESGPPSPEQLEAAKQLLVDDFLVDFPFMDVFRDKGVRRLRPHRPSLFNTIALMLTPIVQNGYDGPAPAFLIDKPRMDIGGSFLAHIIMKVIEGEGVEVTHYFEKNDEENEKRLTTQIISGLKWMFLDDIKSFKSRVYIRFLTAENASGRILGHNLIAKSKNTGIVIVTGKSVQLNDEMGRRVVYINLNDGKTDSKKREYKHDLSTWAMDHRSEIINALLVLVENWIAKGRPLDTVSKKSSFDGWAAVCGGIIGAAWENHGFLKNNLEIGANSSDAQELSFMKDLRDYLNGGTKSLHDLVQWGLDRDTFSGVIGTEAARYNHVYEFLDRQRNATMPFGATKASDATKASEKKNCYFDVYHDREASGLPYCCFRDDEPEISET